MGRQLKRVALDFNWPIGKTWEGFLNPHYTGHCRNCSACDGTGSSPKAKKIGDQWYGNAPFNPADTGSKPWEPLDPRVFAIITPKVLRDLGCYANLHYAGNTPNTKGEIIALTIHREAVRMCELWNAHWMNHLEQADVDALVKAGRLMDFTRTPRTDAQKRLVARRVKTGKHNSWLPKDNGYKPTAAEVNLWSLQGMNHDSINQWVCVKAKCKRLGINPICPACKGEGSVWDSKKNKRIYEAWKPTEPPAGPGYQIWETVSEGSAISPVFDNPEALADWMSQNNRGVDQGTSKNQWLAFIKGPGWSLSFVSTPETGLQTGVQAASVLG